jgi:hypothetical protein
MKNHKVDAHQAIEIAENWFRERGRTLKADAPAFFRPAEPENEIRRTDRWSVFFLLPELKGCDPDHMFLLIDAETGEVEAMPIL